MRLNSDKQHGGSMQLLSLTHPVDTYTDCTHRCDRGPSQILHADLHELSVADWVQ